MASASIGARVLVTGGAGFIGHRLCANLAGEGRHVHIVDNLSVGMPMPSAGGLVSTAKLDICDEAGFDAQVQAFRPDSIVHLAAIHHIPTCEQKRAYSLTVNVVGTENVLAAAERHGVKRVVLASSGAVYDWADGALLEDSTPLRGLDNYALAKLTNESQLAFWSERTGCSARVARIFNTIGHDDPNAHLIPDVLNQIPPGTKHTRIALGNTEPRRDYIHANDTARGVQALLDDPRDVRWDVFNVATGVEISVARLVQEIGAAMGATIEIGEDAARKRRVDRPSQVASTAKIERLLRWKPRMQLATALKDLTERYWQERGRA